MLNLFLFLLAGVPEAPAEVTRPKDDKPKDVIDKEASDLNANMQTDAEEAMANEQQQQQSPGPPRRRIPSWARYLWEKNVTPMSIVRLTGPYGAR